MPTDVAQSSGLIRNVLARHPVAVEVARAAKAFSRSEAEVVLFEPGRSFIIASSKYDPLQPRQQLSSEARVATTGQGLVSLDGSTAVAITSNKTVIGALTLLDSDGAPEGSNAADFANGLHALSRMISAVLRENLESTGTRGTATAILDGLRDAVVLVDAELNIRWVNRAVGSLFLRSEVDLIGRSAAELLHPDDVTVAFDALTRLSAGLETYRVFVRVRRSSGDYERVEITGVDQSENPELEGTVVSLRYAGVEEELEASVERANRMSDAIVAGLRDGIVATDQFGEITMVNSIARDLFGLDTNTPPTSLGLADFAVVDRFGRPIDHNFGDPIDLEGTNEEPKEVCVISTRGDLRFVTTERRPVFDRSGELLGSVISFHDVTESRRAAEELRSQALHDQLTGLANRRQLDQRLGELASMPSDRTVAACFVDLDAFKVINDTHGHRTGDEIVRQAAQRLRSIATANDLLVRHGGDEFVALLTERTGATGVTTEDAAATAEQLRVTLSKPYSVGDQRFDLTASIGVAMATSSELNDDTLLRHADIALYAAKARGRNRIEFFDEDLAQAIKLEERQRRMLRTVLEEDRLVMHFQPLLCVHTGDIYGYEALARCHNEQGSLIGPAGFIEAVTHSALMWDLDRAAFRQSCQAAAVLARLNPQRPPTVACNFSPISLGQAGIVDFVLETVADTEVDPSWICVEITETSALEAGPTTIAALETLDEAGFQIALDDFGTGYSSLSHLRDLPLSSVKVDRSFIKKLTEDSSERAIVAAIVNLAKELNLRVVAEGIETGPQFEQATALGFDLIQGWHYAPALPLEDILTHWSTPESSG